MVVASASASSPFSIEDASEEKRGGGGRQYMNIWIMNAVAKTIRILKNNNNNNNRRRRKLLSMALLFLLFLLLVFLVFGGNHNHRSSSSLNTGAVSISNEGKDQRLGALAAETTATTLDRRKKSAPYMLRVNASSIITTNPDGTKHDPFLDVKPAARDYFAHVQHYHCDGWGEAGLDDIDFTAHNYDAHDIQQILLLHSVHFQKENWKQAGILDTLCAANDGKIMVTAIDLPTSHNQGYNDMINLFYELQQQNLVIQYPISTIVTPYGSAKGIVDFLRQSETRHVQVMKQFIQSWVTISSYHVLGTIEDDLLHKLKDDHFPVLAVHCTQDYEGKATSDRLSDIAAATTLEIYGDHSCYLDDNPHDFANAILQFINDL